jgi:lysophospholipase L1-like esterase
MSLRRSPVTATTRPRALAARLVAMSAAAVLLLTGGVTDAAGGPHADWVGTWASVPTATPAISTPVVENETVRQIVHTSVGGSELRLRLTNEFGATPLRIGDVHVARRASGTTIDPRTDRQVTFAGSEAVTIPAGAPVLSDPVRLALPPRTDLVVSIYLPTRTPVTTLHNFAYQENVVAPGNVADDRAVTADRTTTAWYFLSSVSVRAQASAVVALGDSITNGFETEINQNHRWPDLFAARARGKGVLNLGVAGNRLLHDPNPTPGAESYAALFGESALRRFDRDVLAQPGVDDVIVLLGVNDLGQPGTTAPTAETVTAEEIIGAHEQLVARAHAAGLRIHGGTILPFKGDTLGFYTEENEAKRQKVNRWIRTSGAYDTVLDFDRVMRDPADPRRLDPAYDSGDHLHPNDAGMAAMANAIPMRNF